MSYNENEKLWIIKVAAFQESNMTQLQWCRENKVAPSSLRYWLKKLKPLDKQPVSEPKTFEFESLQIPAEFADKGITLEVGNVKININQDFNEALLRKTIKALQQL